MSSKVSATLDRTGTSTRKSAMIMATVMNVLGTDSSLVPSKSTIHRHRQQNRITIAESIKKSYDVTKSVVHWDGKLIPDVSGSDALIDRLPVLLSSVTDGTIKLLGVPSLDCGTGRAAAEAVHEQLKSWNAESYVIGMCFDTTAANTGKFTGACKLLEELLGRNLLWLACRHHMLEVLLSDAFNVCFGPSSGPEIKIFKRFRENWSKLSHREPPARSTPLLPAPEDLKNFILQQLTQGHPREDYSELLCLAGLLTGMDTGSVIRKPGAIHRARWMAKAIYSLKIELLYEGNETVVHLTARELQGLQRFNRFVVLVYIESWFTSRSAIDAPINDVRLIGRLAAFDDEQLRKVGLNALKRHSWYLSPELATIALFSASPLVTENNKALLVENMTLASERPLHLLTTLPSSISDLHISHTFFDILGLDDGFLSVPVSAWPETESFKDAVNIVSNITCVNDCAERGVALITNFNACTKDETQKQYMLQVVEQHRNMYKQCNLSELCSI